MGSAPIGRSTLRYYGARAGKAHPAQFSASFRIYGAKAPRLRRAVSKLGTYSKNRLICLIFQTFQAIFVLCPASVPQNGKHPVVLKRPLQYQTASCPLPAWPSPFGDTLAVMHAALAGCGVCFYQLRPNDWNCPPSSPRSVVQPHYHQTAQESSMRWTRKY